ncbi:MAG: hypothetical protein JNK15_01845 [Planctomycetes bacterium]|nr:hypothetical protein [Planctomycetota bacterium]
MRYLDSVWFVLAVSGVVASVQAQVLLADDFSSGVVDPAKWSIVTSGIPQGGASVTVQNGQCALRNRGHLVSQQVFDAVANGPFRVRCTWRWTDTGDFFQLLLRSDGVPSGGYGETQHGVELRAEMYSGPSLDILTRSGLVSVGPSTAAGPGVQFVVGVTYTAELLDLGWGFRARVDGPNGQWWEIERAITSSTSPHRQIVVHNREALGMSHLCWLDDVVVEALPAATIAPFGQGCVGPYGLTPTLAVEPGSLPRIGRPCTFVVGALPNLITVPVFVFGFDTTMNLGPGGWYPLPFDLGVLGWPGCQQLVSTAETVATITTTGTAQLSVPLPHLPQIVGFPFYAQAIVLYHPGGVAVTSGLAATIGW